MAINRPNKVQMNTPPNDLSVIPSESSRIGQSLRLVLFQYLPIIGHYYYRTDFHVIQRFNLFYDINDFRLKKMIPDSFSKYSLFCNLSIDLLISSFK